MIEIFLYNSIEIIKYFIIFSFLFQGKFYKDKRQWFRIGICLIGFIIEIYLIQRKVSFESVFYILLIVLLLYEDKMKKTLASLESELATIRAGRANPHILDKIIVDYYGSPTPIQQVANITVPEARMIQIQPWEKKMVREIEKAIMTSDLGINPTNDGTTARLLFPE